MATAAPTGTLVHLNPAEIATDKNIRTDLQLTPEWIKNLKQHGVRTPISAYWDPVLEQYQVEAGHRRTVGAVEAGLPTIPVYVVQTPAGDADRIVDQVVENIQRASLHDVEEAGAYQQLSLFALPAMEIAKRTNSKLARIGDAIRVRRSPAASAVLEQHQVSIDDALVFAEFDDDTEALATLTTTIQTRPEQLAHTAQQLRAERELKQLQQAVIDDLTERGIPILDRAPSYDDPKDRRISSLYTDEKRTTHVKLDAIPAGHLAAVIDSGQRWDGNERRAYAEPSYVVTDFTAAGLFGYKDGTTAKGPLSDAEKEERKTTRENNKLWAPATTVRLAWIKKLLERRTLPQDAPALAALWFSQMRTSTSAGRAGRIAHELLGLTMSGADTYNADTRVLEKFVIDSPNQALHVLVAVAAGSIEGCLDEKDGWRGDHHNTLPPYLKLLSSWGYTLSDIEETILQQHELKTSEAAA